MIDQLNSWATAIGWIVIISGVVFAASKVLSASDDEKRKKFETEYGIRAICYRLALRHIYFANHDEVVRNKVKSFAMQSSLGINGWAMLELKMSDDEFKADCRKSNQGTAFALAESRINEKGYPLSFEADEIKIISNYFNQSPG